MKPPKKRAARGSSKKNKSEFIRSLPADMSASDVIAKAKEAGYGDMSAAYVYSIRTAARARARTRDRVGGRNGAAQASRAPAGVEALLLALASEIGLANALAILQSERQRVLAVLR
jgi:hypothetical protein